MIESDCFQWKSDDNSPWLLPSPFRGFRHPLKSELQRSLDDWSSFSNRVVCESLLRLSCSSLTLSNPWGLVVSPRFPLILISFS